MRRGVFGLIQITAVAFSLLFFNLAFSADNGLSQIEAQQVSKNSVGATSSVRSIAEFLTPNDQFDLEAVRRSGYQGSLDINGFKPLIDPITDQPLFQSGGTEKMADHPDDIYWDNSISQCIPGVNGVVNAATIYNGKLIVGGIFNFAGCITVSNIASWDGSSWSPLGTGMDNGVCALTVYDGKLIAGGYFVTAGGVVVNHIAAWDGSNWEPLGLGANVVVYALTVYDGKLIAGGLTTTGGGVASWDGISWSPLGSGMEGGTHSYPDIYPSVLALCVYDGKLIAGGNFTTAGGVAANQIAAWDGSNWSPLGSGMSEDNHPAVLALTVYDGKLIAGGNFTTAGGVAANQIAAWDGSNWSPLGLGLCCNDSYDVYALVEYNGNLIAGGKFFLADGESANYIAAWDGTSWSPLGSGMGMADIGKVFHYQPREDYLYSLSVEALCVYDGELIAGGDFTTAGSASANYIASWDGSKWSSLGLGIGNTICALTVYGGNLIAGSTYAIADGASANYVAYWNGSGWSPLGSGMDGSVYALTVYDGKLIAGGEFTTADGASANYIAAWNGSGWTPLGSGMDSSVYALTVYDGKLIAGGYFKTAGGMVASHIASWNGSSWSPLGSGMGGIPYPDVHVLAVHDGNLIAGGQFTMAGGVAANYIASWDGSDWSPLGLGIEGGYNTDIEALSVYHGKLIAGGEFGTAGGVEASSIASWDGNSWSPMGSGIQGEVYSLTVYDDKLIVGGGLYRYEESPPSYNITLWNGSRWWSLGYGISGGSVVSSYGFDPFVFALTIYNGQLIAGGNFTIAGNKFSPYLAAWTTPLDSDGDGFSDGTDNCPTVYDQDQSDLDGDRFGDVCDYCPTEHTLRNGKKYSLSDEICISGEHGETWKCLAGSFSASFYGDGNYLTSCSVFSIAASCWECHTESSCKWGDYKVIDIIKSWRMTYCYPQNNTINNTITNTEANVDTIAVVEDMAAIKCAAPKYIDNRWQLLSMQEFMNEYNPANIPMPIIYDASTAGQEIYMYVNLVEWIQVSDTITPANEYYFVNGQCLELPGIYFGTSEFQFNEMANPGENPLLSQNPFTGNLLCVGANEFLDESYICGDANGDDKVNLLDVSYIISALYRGGPKPNPIQSADVNHDEKMNLLDVSYIINYLYRQGPAPSCP
jgi:hypothetical protein